MKETLERRETMNKKLNIVIMGLGELGQGFYDILKETNSNIYVVSVSGQNDKQYAKSGIHPYNRYEGFPIPYEDIDAVLLCCRTTQLEKVKTLIPEEVLPKVVDRFIAFQNGFNLKEKLIATFGKSIPRCIPYLSFKNDKNEKIQLTFAKSSPIKGAECEKIHDVITSMNTYTHEKFGKYLFEGVDSIALEREGEYKAMLNAVLNSLSVIYKANVETSITKFEKEFGEKAIHNRSAEISNIMNIRYDKSPFETNTGEVEYRVLQLAKKFAKEKPSTYNQYYDVAPKRGKIFSEDDHLLGYLIKKAKEKGIPAPISNEIWQRMKTIETEINNHLQKK